MAFIPATSFPLHFHKPDGSLAIGCILAVFQASTTTPEPLYLDEDGTEAGTTFTLNDRGEFEVSGNTIVPWIDTEVAYKYSLTDPDSGLQWTVDDVIAPVREATESYPGIVQLYDDVDSSSSTMAATANAVRIAYEMAQTAVAIASAGIPVGAEILWPLASPPDATWLECDGRSLLVADYPEYFAVIGYSYGGADTNFNMPDWRGKFPRGWAHGSANDPDRAARTNRGDGTTGDAVGTNQAFATVDHMHTTLYTAKSAGSLDWSYPDALLDGAGGGQAQEKNQTNIAFSKSSKMNQANYAGVPAAFAAANLSTEVRPINMGRVIIAKVKSSLA